MTVKEKDGKFLSLRRHDPDQVRRVSAGPCVKAADSQPLAWGSPRNDLNLNLGAPLSKGRRDQFVA